MIFFTPEFLLYPYVYMSGLMMLFFISRGTPNAPAYFMAGFVIYNIFWLTLFGLFSVFYNYIPCKIILGHSLGGC